MGLKHVYTDLDKDGRLDDFIMQYPDDSNHIYVDEDGDGFYDDRVPVINESDDYILADFDGDGFYDDIIFTPSTRTSSEHVMQHPSHPSHTHRSSSRTHDTSSNLDTPKLSFKTWFIIAVILCCIGLCFNALIFISNIIQTLI